jgi:putative ABC transport system permease protein
LSFVQGRWLKSGGEPEAVMNQQAMKTYGNPAIGEYQQLNLGGKMMKVKLVGVVEEFDKAKIYLDKEQYDAVANPDHLVNSLMFVAQDKSYAGVVALKKEIEKAIAPTGLNVLYVMSPAERTRIIYDHLNIILTVLVTLSFLVLFVATMGMSSATGINILERTREIGILRAIGATPRRIYTMFVMEGMVVSIASIILGLLLAWPLSLMASPLFGNLMLGNGARLQFAYSMSGFWITLIVTLFFGWLASRIPAQKAIRVSTREALAYE